MKVLLIKTSSLGDIVHAFPAISDACASLPELQIDWVVEEGFQDIARLHPGINRVLPCAIRRWRQNIFRSIFSGEWKAFKNEIRAQEYDFVIDAQGLIKSAFITRLARGQKTGLDSNSAREPLSSKVLDRRIAISPSMHAIERTRLLFAAALDYQIELGHIDYGLRGKERHKQSIMFLHGTTWTSKLWPEDHWRELAILCEAKGFQIKIPWGCEEEKARAERIVAGCKGASVLAQMPLSSLAEQIASMGAVVSMDTGLGHLAAALECPVIALYGPTHVSKTGLMGSATKNLSVNYECAPCLERVCPLERSSNRVNPPCYQTLTPQRVFKSLLEILT